MMDLGDDINLRDEVAIQMDKRKLQALVSLGLLSFEDIVNARHLEIQPSCHCGEGMVFIEGEQPICPTCSAPGTEVEGA
jgi:hypothetical protein